jgi:hypothetical protein
MDSVQDAEMIWGEMKWCQKIDGARRSTGATTSSAVTHRIRIFEFYNNFFFISPPLSNDDGKGQVFIGYNYYFDLNTRINSQFIPSLVSGCSSAAVGYGIFCLMLFSCLLRAGVYSLKVSVS